MNRTMGRTGALLAMMWLAAPMSAHVRAQKPAPPPLVVDTEFAALDRALWGKGEWFSVPAYHALGEQAYDKVMIRRHQNDKAGTWDSGLEMSVAMKEEGTVLVKTRLTVLNPKGSHDKTVMVLVEVMQGTVTVRKANLKMDVESREEKSSQATFTLPTDLLTSQPALSLRLTLTTANS